MDELLLKDLEPTETEVAENVQGKEGQDDTGEGQTEKESRVSKKTIEQPKKRGREKMNCPSQNWPSFSEIKKNEKKFPPN